MKKNELKAYINSDLYRYCGSTSIKSLITCLIKFSGFRYTYLLRKAKYYKSLKRSKVKYIFYGLLVKKYRVKYGYEIPIVVNIGKGFLINHLGGIAINPTVKIGDNVCITKGVTIGQESRGKREGSPIIGNRVWIGTNATIVGKVNIGNNVLIAPNSYINFDVPDNSIVIGNPAKIINKVNATDGYMQHLYK